MLNALVLQPPPATPPRQEKIKAFRWTLSALGRDTRKFPCDYFCYITPERGVAVRVSGKDPRTVLRVANTIEAMEVTRS